MAYTLNSGQDSTASMVADYKKEPKILTNIWSSEPESWIDETALFDFLSRYYENLKKYYSEGKLKNLSSIQIAQKFGFDVDNKEDATIILNAIQTNDIKTIKNYKSKLTKPMLATVVTTKAPWGKVAIDPTDFIAVDNDIVTTYYEFYPQLINDKLCFLDTTSLKLEKYSFQGIKQHIEFREEKTCTPLGDSTPEAELQFLLEVVNFSDANCYKQLIKHFNKDKTLKDNLRTASCFFCNNWVKDLTPEQFINYSGTISKKHRNDYVVTCYESVEKGATKRSKDIIASAPKILPKEDLKKEIAQNRVIALPELDLYKLIEIINNKNFMFKLAPKSLLPELEKIKLKLQNEWSKVKTDQQNIKLIQKYHELKSAFDKGDKNVSLQELISLGNEVSGIYKENCPFARRSFHFITDQMNRTPYILIDHSYWKTLPELEQDQTNFNQEVKVMDVSKTKKYYLSRQAATTIKKHKLQEENSEISSHTHKQPNQLIK